MIFPLLSVAVGLRIPTGNNVSTRKEKLSGIGSENKRRPASKNAILIQAIKKKYQETAVKKRRPTSKNVRRRTL